MRLGIAHGGAWMFVAGVAGCSFDAGGVGNGRGDTSFGTGTTTDETGSTSDQPSTSMASGASTVGTSETTTSDSGTGTTDDDDTTTTGTGGQALVEIVEAPSYDYGAVGVGGSVTNAFVIRNDGDATATELGAAIDAPPFALDGPWPGEGGTCTAVLDPGSTCTVAVAFAPIQLGVRERELAVTYHDGRGSAQAACALRGGGAGTSANLVTNGDAETNGNPPTGWTEVAGNTWRTADFAESDIPPHSGELFIWPEEGDDVELVQNINLAVLGESIANGGLRFEFEIYMRSLNSGEDEARASVEYRDAGNNVLGEPFDTDWLISSFWDLHADARELPAGTTHARVRLLCNRVNGEFCDAAFDDIVLRATYP